MLYRIGNAMQGIRHVMRVNQIVFCRRVHDDKLSLLKSILNNPQSGKEEVKDRVKYSGDNNRDNKYRNKRDDRDRNRDDRDRSGYKKREGYVKREGNNTKYGNKYGNKKYSRNDKYDKYDKQEEVRKDEETLLKEKRIKEIQTVFNTGNDRDKEAAKRIIKEVLESNKKGIVQIIREGGKVEYCHIYDSFGGMKLNEKGFLIVGNRNVKGRGENDENIDKFSLEEGEKVIILKVSDREQVIKQYGDYLNGKVVEILKQSNSKIIEKQTRGKEKESMGNGIGSKLVQIGWNISSNDLMGQKRFEIESHLRRGDDIDIVIDDREVLDKDNQFGNNGNDSKQFDNIEEKMVIYRNRRKDINEVERLRRKKVISKLKEMLSSVEGLLESNVGEERGYLESRIVMRVKGIKMKRGKEEDKKDKKEQRQMERQRKAERNAQRRLEKLKQQQEKLKEIVL